MKLHVIKDKYPWDLLLLADPDKAAINRYLETSDCYEARDEAVLVGVAVLRKVNPKVFELMNIAVSPQHQKQGYGGRILTTLIQLLKDRKAEKLEVGTGTFGYPLKFYQQYGFRVTAIKKDFFLENYPEPVIEEGLQHKDMLMLSMALTP